MNLLQDLCSKDPRRIWEAASAILRLWDRQLLADLATHLEQIREQTAGIDLGGALHPNAVHLHNALARLEFVRADQGCLCALYAADKFSNPSQEAALGRIAILETQHLEGGDVDFYRCKCLTCGTTYRVTERAYHYTFWEWSRD